MKKQLNIKKLILLNLPYILMGLFSTNFGEAWRMAVGADAVSYTHLMRISKSAVVSRSDEFIRKYKKTDKRSLY